MHAMDFTIVTAFIAHVILLPPASLFLLILIGWLLQRRWPRLGQACRGIGISLLFVLSTHAGADLLVAPLEALTRPLAPGEAAKAQAIVVLAAGRLEKAPEYGGTHVPDYIALARLRYAARLQHQTGLPILLTGGNRSTDAMRESKAAGMARALREDFRTPVRWIEEDAETTAENARNSRRMLEASGVHRILLVTDAMHMPRSEKVFRESGLEVIAAPTVFLHRTGFDLAELIPTAEALRLSYYAAYEWTGILWYRLRAR
jgi:uncharacterized SAM-binding protein YcdF (DUF218 family)